jgi:hypothetical protein
MKTVFNPVPGTRKKLKPGFDNEPLTGKIMIVLNPKPSKNGKRF